MPEAPLNPFGDITTLMVWQKGIETNHGLVDFWAFFALFLPSAVSFHNFIYLPPVIGMLTGLSYIQFSGYYLKKTAYKDHHGKMDGPQNEAEMGTFVTFDVFNKITRAEWDTLLFFYGVVLCVGGLGFMGYLSLVS